MKDGIPKGSGNSRFLKSVENFKTLYPTYDAFVAGLVAGTLPIDLNGINPEGWEQIGDALGKYALLKDSTAALYNFGNSALPDDIARIMARLHTNLGNEYLWARRGYTPPSSTLTSKGETPLFSFDYYMNVNVADAINVSDDGTITLENPVSRSMSSVTTTKQYLLGKYFVVTDGVLGNINRADVYFCPANSEITSAQSGGIYYITASDLYVVTGVAAVLDGLSYVNSPDPNAYPVNDGYIYTALGMLGEKTRIVTGSYTGNGNYGSSSYKNSLTFDFVPELIFISATSYSGGGYGQETIIRYGSTNPGSRNPGMPTDKNYNDMLTATFSDNTISWYSSKSAVVQLNASGAVYDYVAIG